MLTISNLLSWIKTRWLGLVIGFVLLGTSYVEADSLYALLGSIVLIQAITGKGCFGGSCRVQ